MSARGKPDQPEHRLSHYIDMLIDRVVVEPFWATAIDNAQPLAKKDGTGQEVAHARMAWEQKRRARGIRPAHLDWYLFQRPIFGQCELKIAGTETEAENAMSDRQKATRKLLLDRGIPAGLAWSVLTFFEWLQVAGYRLHPNAHNIAKEIELRWRAADEAKRGAAPAKKPRASKPRAAKPTLQQVRKLNRMRAQVRF